MIDDAMEMGDLDTGAAKQFSYDVSKGVKASAAKAGKGERGGLAWALRVCVLVCGVEGGVGWDGVGARSR